MGLDYTKHDLLAKPRACKYGCGTLIHFDPNVKSRNDKLIPLEEDGQIHNQCLMKQNGGNDSDKSLIDAFIKVTASINESLDSHKVTIQIIKKNSESWPVVQRELEEDDKYP